MNDAYSQIPGRIRRDREVTSDAYRVYGALAERAGRDTGQAWPSLVTLAADAAISVTRVQKALRVLKRCGYIEWERRPRQSNRYTLLVRVASGRVVDRSNATVADRSPATNEPEQANQSKKQSSEGASAGGNYERSGSGNEGRQADVVPLRRAVGE